MARTGTTGEWAQPTSKPLVEKTPYQAIPCGTHVAHQPDRASTALPHACHTLWRGSVRMSGIHRRTACDPHRAGRLLRSVLSHVRSTRGPQPIIRCWRGTDATSVSDVVRVRSGCSIYYGLSLCPYYINACFCRVGKRSHIKCNLRV